MVGVVLRTHFDIMPLDIKCKIKKLCEKYGVKPECNSGGELENMSFDFGDNVNRRDVFVKEMELILDAPCTKVKRRVFGHKIECPLPPYS